MDNAVVDRPQDPWTVRGVIYATLAASGRAPSRTQIAAELDWTAEAVDSALRFLSEAHVLALDGDGEVWMAHPFSAIETAFQVRTAGASYWANCAWDAVAIPMLLGVDGVTDASCPHTGETLTLAVESGTLRDVSAVIHYPVAAADFWKDIGFT